jgi:hypothetical protein
MNLQQLLMYLPILTEYFPYIELLLQFRTADNAKRHEIVAQFYTIVVTRLRPMFAERNDVPTTKLIDDILAAVRTYINDATSYGPPSGGVGSVSGSVGVNPVPPPVQVPVAGPATPDSPLPGGYSGSWPAYPLEEEAHYKQPPMDPRWAELAKRNHQPDGGKGIAVDPTPIPAPVPPTTSTLQSPPYDFIQYGPVTPGLIVALRAGDYGQVGKPTWPAVHASDVLWTGIHLGNVAWQVLPAGYAGRPGWTGVRPF